MGRSIRFASGVVALSMAIVFSASGSTFGQMRRASIGDLYGIGVEGTIGRGTQLMPGGPSNPGGPGPWNGYGSQRRNDFSSPDAYGSWYPGYSYSSGYSGSRYPGGYSYAPRTYAPRGVAAPYLTNRYYEPGDGYRYPLYYNPATGTYFYYPVRR